MRRTHEQAQHEVRLSRERSGGEDARRDQGVADDEAMTVFTVGHSNHPIERFEELLCANRVTAVADVRSAPYSRFSPQFNREELRARLRDRGIAYVYLGYELGGRGDDSDYDNDPSDRDNNDRVNNQIINYDRLAAKPSFEDGIERVLRGASRETIVLLCAEKEPLGCHRTLLVGRALAERGVRVEHILADGTRESHDRTMDRLLDKLGMKGPTQMSLLPDQAGAGTPESGDLIADAIAKQAALIGHRRRSPASTRRPADGRAAGRTVRATRQESRQP